MDTEFRQRLARGLERELPYSERRVLQGGREASVLVLLGASTATPGEPAVLITQRTETVASHKGQMAFPGGAAEPEEIARGREGLVSAALRETCEEVGLAPEVVEVVGTLPDLTTITHYCVTPVVGLLRGAIEDFALTPSADEIAHALWVPLAELERVYAQEFLRVGAVDYPIHVYQVGPHRIWGATGAMLKNLLDRLSALG